MNNQVLHSNEDTIAAISTAIGEGGIGIVRLSGGDSLTILKKIFRPVAGATERDQQPCLPTSDTAAAETDNQSLRPSFETAEAETVNQSCRPNSDTAEAETDKQSRRPNSDTVEAETDKQSRRPNSDAVEAETDRQTRLPGADLEDRFFENRRLTYGNIVDPADGAVVDEVMAVYMKGPHTYTCEDVVEIQCHGSLPALRKILSLTLQLGARSAEKGEFTKRAFLNGRLDLAQAEAVIDIIQANTEDALGVAVDQLDGRLSMAVRSMRKELLNTLVQMAVNMDYPDEDIEEVIYGDLAKDLNHLREEIHKLIATAGAGRLLKEGVKVAIVGKPNVGKSSLLNALMGEDRAIVTAIPGTTRDVISEYIILSGIPVRLIDTAGIRETEDTIEKIGIEKSLAAIKEADLILFVLDKSRPLESEDGEIAAALQDRPVIVIMNKSDKAALWTEEDVLSMDGVKTDTPLLSISLKELAEANLEGEIREDSSKEDLSHKESFIQDGSTISSLQKDTIKQAVDDIVFSISQVVFDGNLPQRDSITVTSARHEGLLRQASASLADALAQVDVMEALDIIEIDVRNAYEFLGEILGESLKDDIIEEVFARFCLGK